MEDINKNFIHHKIVKQIKSINEDKFINRVFWVVVVCRESSGSRLGYGEESWSWCSLWVRKAYLDKIGRRRSPRVRSSSSRTSASRSTPSLTQSLDRTPSRRFVSLLDNAVGKDVANHAAARGSISSTDVGKWNILFSVSDATTFWMCACYFTVFETKDLWNLFDCNHVLINLNIEYKIAVHSFTRQCGVNNDTIALT